MTPLDTLIQTSLTSLEISWFPSMERTQKNNSEYIQKLNEVSYFPLMIQAVEDEIERLPNGEIRRIIPFYLLSPITRSDNDVLGEINPIYEALTVRVLNFIDLIKKEFNCKLNGRLTKFHHLTPLSEAGIAFQLEVTYYPCYNV